MIPLLRLRSVVIMLIGSSLLTGCFGYDRILFVTKTNVGLDVENKPPTAEITIARRELAIAPTFRDTTGEHKTPPLLASFGRTGGFFTTGLKSQFAGGDAAVWLGEGLGGTQEKNSSICLDKEPDSRPPLKKLWHWLTGGRPDENTRAFYFATDTTFGLKVGWDGTGGPYPTNLKLGYNRKELAFPPVFINSTVSKKDRCSIKDESGELVKVKVKKPDGTFETDKDGNFVEEVKKGYKVTVPSFFASLDNESLLATPEGSTLSHVQFFATGKAATGFVRRPEVNADAFKEMRSGQ